MGAINDRIRRLRQERFGERGKARFAAALGLSPSTYHGYEKGTEPVASTLARMYEVTNVNLCWLLCGIGAMFQGSDPIKLPEPDLVELITRQVALKLEEQSRDAGDRGPIPAGQSEVIKFGKREIPLLRAVSMPRAAGAAPRRKSRSGPDQPYIRRYIRGEVAADPAGAPLAESAVGSAFVPSYVSPDNSEHDLDYILQVRGDSMTDMDIRDGDLILIQGRSPIRDADIAVVVMRDADDPDLELCTLKKVFLCESDPEAPIILFSMARGRKPIPLPKDRFVRFAGKFIAKL